MIFILFLCVPKVHFLISDNKIFSSDKKIMTFVTYVVYDINAVTLPLTDCWKSPYFKGSCILIQIVKLSFHLHSHFSRSIRKHFGKKNKKNMWMAFICPQRS